jgi:hypothetical protein
MANADDHLRLIKATLKATFGHTGALTNSDDQLVPAAGTLTKPAYSFAAEPTLGLYRSAAGVMSVAGGSLSPKHVLPVGAVFMFPKEPASLGKVTADTGKDYLELNGATYNTADYPDLAAFLGAVGSTFQVPGMTDTGRFPRSRTGTLAALTVQANTVGPHTHPDVTPTTAAETQDHTHTFSGTTGTEGSAHSHGYFEFNAGSGNAGGAGGGFKDPSQTQTSTESSLHTHNFSGTTNSRSATHNHTVTVSTPANTGTTETRPEALSLVFVIKT